MPIDEVEAWAQEYNAKNFELSWDALPEWARESHRATARKALGLEDLPASG